MSDIQIHCKYDVLLNPSDLKDHPKNRNKHDAAQVERLAKLYTYHGIRHPIIVSNLSGFIVAGHGRKLAALKAGLEWVPVVYQDFASEDAEYAFIQADNAIALWADLDLASINADLPELGPDFDLDLLGIKNFTLDPSEAEFPELSGADPGFQQRTFILSNEQNDILDQALEKARAEEDCVDELNQNANANALIAGLKRYVHG